VGTACLTVEGATRETYDSINRAIGWPPAPEPAPSGTPQSVAQLGFVAGKPARDFASITSY
jgi:hypothetical protein